MFGADSSLSNTPGIYYTIAYCLSSCFYISMNERRLHGWRLYLTQAVIFCALGGFMVATDGIDQRLFIPCILMEFFLLWLSICVACRMDAVKVTYFAIRAFFLGEFAASLEWQLYYYGLTGWGIEDGPAQMLCFLVLCHGSVFAVMYLLERGYREGNRLLKITGRELRVEVLLALVMYVISNISYAMKNTPFSSQYTAEIFIIRTLADLGGVGILYAYHVQLHEVHLRLERNYLQGMLELQYENYKVSAESVEIVNRKYHDLKHQIAFLRELDSSEERNAYLDQMEQEIRSYEAQNKTGNKVLDTILTAKSLQCQQEDITLTCVADGEALSFMDPMDVSALFGNALDNAIESVREISEKDQRLIHLSMTRQKGFLRIRVENRYVGELTFRDGMPLTTKKNKAFHGFGTRSIRQTAEKYGGSMNIETREGWFELRVLFPLDQRTTPTDSADAGFKGAGCPGDILRP